MFFCFPVLLESISQELWLFLCYSVRIKKKCVEFLLLICISSFDVSGIFQKQGVLKLWAIVWFSDIFNPLKFSWIYWIIVDSDKLVLCIHCSLSLAIKKIYAKLQKIFSCNWNLFPTEKTDFKSFQNSLEKRKENNRIKLSIILRLSAYICQKWALLFVIQKFSVPWLIFSKT